MIKYILVFVLFSSVSEARPMDPDGRGHVFGELDLRYLKKYDDLRFVSELRVRNSFENRIYSHFKLGFNYRIFSKLKFGLHHRLQRNNRNIDDWKNLGLRWMWMEQNNGIENVISPQVLFRNLISDKIRFELRAQQDFNLSNGYQTLRIRPNLTYFVVGETGSQSSFYLQYESFVPLNYAEGKVLQRWMYIGGLFPLSGGQRWGVSLALAEWVWTASVNFKEQLPTEDYELSDKAAILAFTYLYSN